jgi:hypothetical protein
VALKKAKAINAKLQEKLVDTMESRGTNEENNEIVPRPEGAMGSKWSIQIEMGLGGVGKKYDIYKAIQVSNNNLRQDNCLLTLSVAKCLRLGSQHPPQLGSVMV